MGKTVIVDRVISLGANCEATCNIRGYFKSERAFPFDWWTTPYNSLIALLNTRFEGLFDPHNLVVTSDMQTVRCNRFNILHHHDFLRDKEGKVLPDIGSQLPALRDKYRYLIERFYRECRTGRTLFVRNRTGYGTHLLPDSDDIFEEKIVSLHDLLAGTFPEATNYLLAANLGKKGRSENKNIIWDEITNYRDAEDYRISPRGWAELFDRNGFTLCSDRRPLTHSGAFMENDSNTELTVEEIMGRIKEEVACKKNERVASSAAEGRQRIQNSLFAPPVTEQENPVFTMLKKLQAVAANLPFYPFVHVFAKKLKTVIPRSQEVILIEDLCEYEDESFIMTAYRSILSRDPDDEGLDRFSTLLRNDQISKVEIIGRIRYSWEGRKGRVRVKGLFFRFAVAILLRAPIIGRILRKIASARVKK